MNLSSGIQGSKAYAIGIVLAVRTKKSKNTIKLYFAKHTYSRTIIEVAFDIPTLPEQCHVLIPIEERIMWDADLLDEDRLHYLRNLVNILFPDDSLLLSLFYYFQRVSFK